MWIVAEIEQVACQPTRSTYPKTSWVLKYRPRVFFGKHRHYEKGNILDNFFFIEYSAAIHHPQNLYIIIIITEPYRAASAKNLPGQV
jgi:hypothetical protein